MNDRSEKYDRIISAASSLFGRSDFQSVCMEEVAVEARVGKGTLYNYFQSKEDLYFSIITYRLENFLDTLTNAFNDRDDFLKNMWSLVIHLHKFLAGYPDFHKIWTREEHSLVKGGNEAIFVLRERILALISGVLEQGRKEKLLREDIDSGLAAQLVYCAVTYVDYETRPDRLFTMLMKGIGAEGVDFSVEHESKKHEKKQ